MSERGPSKVADPTFIQPEELAIIKVLARRVGSKRKLARLMGYQDTTLHRFIRGHYTIPVIFRVRVNMLSELAGLPAPFVIDLEASQQQWLDSIVLEFEQAINKKKKDTSI